jgi:autophagy-related protein 5
LLPTSTHPDSCFIINPPPRSPGRPTTLRELLQINVPLLFPPPPSVPLAYAIVQGIVTPGDADVAWLNACLAGVDGWLAVFVGIGIVSDK